MVRYTLMQEILQRKSTRIEVIDVLRGFTLLGIAFVHFTEQYYAGMPPATHPDFTSHGLTDQIVAVFIGVLIQGKFFMIFSFLFGLSFFLQLNKSDGSGTFILRFSWRLLTLFLIGFVHHLHYRGDILTIYAVLGLGLLICHKLPDKILLVLALLLVFNLPSIVARTIGALDPSSTGPSFFNPDQKQLEFYYDTVKAGSYLAILKANFYEFKGKFVFQVESGRLYITLGLFLLGLYAGRKNVFADVAFFKRLIRYALWTLLGCVLFTATLFGGTKLAGVELAQPVQFLVGASVFDIFNASLASIYVGLLVSLFQKDRWRKRLMTFYAVGRMGLTTYLMQTLIGIFIFFSVGLGILGEIGAAVSLVIGILVFVLQILFSNYWLKRYQYGPVEWVWRSLTYLKIQPIKNRGES